LKLLLLRCQWKMMMMKKQNTWISSVFHPHQLMVDVYVVIAKKKKEEVVSGQMTMTMMIPPPDHFHRLRNHPASTMTMTMLGQHQRV
jgi:hypothetical protein